MPRGTTNVEAVAAAAGALLIAATAAFLALRLVIGVVAALLKWCRQAWVLRHTPMAPGASPAERSIQNTAQKGH